jgi:hypothetical protein
MAINIITKLQQNLGYPELKKIDPNTQEAKLEGGNLDEQRMGQAVVPAVTAGLYQLSKTDEGVRAIAGEENVVDWNETIFGNHADQIIKNVAAYASSSSTVASDRLNKAGFEAIKIIREQIKPTPHHEDLKVFINNQRDHILPYLPAALHLGDLLENPNMDDRTNKMQGPVSSVMHKIEKAMGGHETKEDLEEKKLNY